MRNTSLSLILFLFSVALVAQSNIGVKSFTKIENDMSARIEFPKKDQNGDVCAIIKVETTQTGFSWDSDMSGIIAAVPKVGEYWLYVPYGAKRLTIKHPQLGILRDYLYPLPIEKATVYLLKLTTGKVITTVEETIESQWLVITPEPADAAVYIDNVFVKAGTYSAKHKPGSYIYRVEAPLYYTEAGKVEVTDAKKDLNVKLKPAFGYVTVTTEPEKDAKVIIDGKTLTNNSPCKSEALASGEHTVQVIKEMYQPTAQKVMVTDGQTTPVNFTLQPNFAEITITAPTDATIYVNNQLKATGTWNGRLNAGIYSLEARLDKHRTAKQDIELAVGDKRTLDLQPTPIYGSLDVISSPLGATITINGKEYGITPNTISKLLIGDYTVQLSKTAYANVNKTVTVSEGKSVEVNETLVNGKPVTINSTPAGAFLFIDNQQSGTTPYTSSLTFGNHTIRIEQNGKRAEKNIIITQTGGETNFTLSFGPPTVTDIDGNVYHTVKIGAQTWMVENLKTTQYNDGTAIPLVTDNTAWSNLSTPAYCWYNNDAATYKNKYGALYNWFAVNTGKLAPVGWHVPTDAEWTTLTTYLGGENVAGGKLKETGTLNWTSPNAGATNETGFSALPSGNRLCGNGAFGSLGTSAHWWSATEYYTSTAWYRYMSGDGSYVGRSDGDKAGGFSVRCVRD